MMRSSILGASTMLNVLIQHLPLQSLSWTKICKAFRASDPSNYKREEERGGAGGERERESKINGDQEWEMEYSSE